MRELKEALDSKVTLIDFLGKGEEWKDLFNCLSSRNLLLIGQGK